MKVHEVMTTDVESCDPAQDLATAAMIMWRKNCGVVPVVESESRRALGVITDRDICIAVATKHQRAGEISVGEVFSGSLHACGPDDDLEAAMEIMRSRQVRRVPVVDDEGRLQGIVSIHDLVTRGPSATGRSKVAESELLDVLRGVSGRAEEAVTARPARRTRSSSGASSRRPAAAAYAGGQ